MAAEGAELGVWVGAPVLARMASMRKPVFPVSREMDDWQECHFGVAP